MDTDYIEEAVDILEGEEVHKYRKPKPPAERVGFVQITHALTFYNGVSSEALRVYMAYKSFADLNEEGETYVGITKLSMQLGMSAATLKRARTELVKKGLISIEHRGFGQTSMVYIEDINEHEGVRQVAEQILFTRGKLSNGIKNEPSLGSKMIPLEGSKMIPHNNKKINNNNDNNKKIQVSPLATTGRAFSPVPKPGKRYADTEHEYVPEGEEFVEKHDPTPIELLIGQLTGMKHFSANNKRKMYDPVGVLFGGEHIMEGSPAEELEKYPYEFTEWVKARNTYLKQNGGTSTAKLLQSIRNGYDTEKYGWLARRPKPVTSPTDPNAPWM